MNNITLAEQADNRSALYALLKTFFVKEPSSRLVQFLKNNLSTVLAENGITLHLDSRNKNVENLVEELILEYTRLFIGPGKHVSLYESIYREGGGSLWGEATSEVKKFIESLGIKYRTDWHGLPDHIGIELELMQKLTLREKEAWIQKDEKEAFRCLQIEDKFINEHLIQWVPVFCEMVLQEASVPFYREIARVTKEFIESEHKEVQIILSKIKRKDGLMKKKETVKNVV